MAADVLKGLRVWRPVQWRWGKGVNTGLLTLCRCFSPS